MSLERYKAKCLFYQGRFQENIILEVSDGTILRIASKENFKGQTITNLGNVALLPGTVNTHNHSFQSLVRGFGDDKPFVEWLDRGIYQYSLNLTKDDIYTGALFAFGEMLKHG
ncbi:MAG: amidohydrolase family protein, partial [Deltaproteobacteria bacterium]|nr:amidohydrolase family protein [Deltaproteobacteria bacterium]